MLRLALVCLAAPALVLAAACGDDDDATPTPTLTSDGSTPVPTETAPAGDGKTEAPEETPADATPEPTAPGEVPTAPPPASTGTPAVAPDDQGAFAGQFQGQPIDFEDCAYDPTEGLVTCPGHGLFAINPPIVGQDVSCNIWIVSGAAEVIQCTSQQPQQSTYYEIQE